MTAVTVVTVVSSEKITQPLHKKNQATCQKNLLNIIFFILFFIEKPCNLSTQKNHETFQTLCDSSDCSDSSE